MADKVEFELVSPKKILFSDAVDMVVVPGAEGDFGVLPNHAPFISQVRPGVIAIHGAEDSAQGGIFVAGGFAEVTPERCIVLAEEAVPVSDIDTNAAGERLTSARAAVESAETDGARSQALRDVAIAEAMIAAAS
ncbi:MAG: F0F1 ATP synthase subunit epsilon [Alphaproteobacteria bacterium]|jgi:F-type H+-transporting ATPase subunit epsilon